MDCPDEIVALERAVKSFGGTGEVKVNLMAGTATIVHETSVTSEALIRAIGTAGLRGSPRLDADRTKNERGDSPGRICLASVIVPGMFTGLSLLAGSQNLVVPRANDLQELGACFAAQRCIEC